MTIELDEKQTKLYNDTIKLCAEIESEMHNTIEPTNPEEVQLQMSKVIPYLSNLSKMQETATAIYSWGKGKVAEEIMFDRNKFDDIKSSVIALFIQGRLAKYNALYDRVESVSKNLRSSIEGLRTLLSYEKENIRENKFGSQT